MKKFKKYSAIAAMAIASVVLSACNSGGGYDAPDKVVTNGPAQFEGGAQAGADGPSGTAKQADSAASEN